MATIRRQPERHEQAAVTQLLATLGAKCYVAGTTRPRGDYQGTCQTPGLPDMPLVFLPRYKTSAALPEPMYELVVIEVKSTTAHATKHGGLSAFQRECKAYCLGAGIPYIHGPLDVVIQWLVDHGYLKASQVPHYRLRPTATG